MSSACMLDLHSHFNKCVAWSQSSLLWLNCFFQSLKKPFQSSKCSIKVSWHTVLEHVTICSQLIWTASIMFCGTTGVDICIRIWHVVIWLGFKCAQLKRAPGSSRRCWAARYTARSEHRTRSLTLLPTLACFLQRWNTHICEPVSAQIRSVRQAAWTGGDQNDVLLLSPCQGSGHGGHDRAALPGER